MDPAGSALPSAVGGAGERVEHPEVSVPPLQRLQFVSVDDLVLVWVAVDEPDRNGQRPVCCVLGHAFEGRDADSSRDEIAGRISCRTKSPIGPKTSTSSSGCRAKARLYGESERRTAYSRCGRVGLVASDIGRASMPCSVNNCRKVNWVGPNMKAFGFSSSMAWVVGVSCREETTRSLKPLEGPTIRGPLRRRQ